MSDSEDSTVTYTSISSDDGSLEVGSLGVVVYGYDGLPMHPPSPDYVPGPEHPPLPDFVPEPVYPEFMPPKDDVLPAKEQPLPAAVSPTTESPGYITESDPEEDLEVEDDEDPEEDPADYPTGKDDDEEEEEESSEDDVDDEEEDEDEDEEEEEENLALVDSIPPPAYHTTARISIRDQTPIPFPSEAEIPSPPLPVSSPLPMSPPPLLASPTHLLGYRAAMIRLRAESPSTSHLLPLPLPIVLPHTRASMAVMRAAAPSTYILASRSETPPSGTPPLYLYHYLHNHYLCFYPLLTVEKMFPRADYGFVGTLDAEIRRDPDREIGYGITDVWEDPDEIAEEIPATDVDDRLLMSGQLNLLRRDRRVHDYTTRLMKGEARASREAWVQSMDASDMTRSKVRALRTTVLAQHTKIRDLQAADHMRQTQLTKVLTLLRTLQTQMAALQSQQTLVRDPTHPDVPEEAGSSS
ncbi:hypothetical protein Tco_0179177 [Tanacetum coccineum]